MLVQRQDWESGGKGRKNIGRGSTTGQGKRVNGEIGGRLNIFLPPLPAWASVSRLVLLRRKRVSLVSKAAKEMRQERRATGGGVVGGIVRGGLRSARLSPPYATAVAPRNGKRSAGRPGKRERSQVTDVRMRA